MAEEHSYMQEEHGYMPEEHGYMLQERGYIELVIVCPATCVQHLAHAHALQ